MRTRSGARLRSASLPPPASPSLLSQANEVSENSLILENTEVSRRQVGEPAVRANNPNSVEASIFPSPSSEEDKGPEVLGYENLEPSIGSHDPLAAGAVDCEFVTPTRYAKNVNGSVSRASLASDEQYFPAWFSDPRVGKSQNENKYRLSDSLPDDEYW